MTNIVNAIPIISTGEEVSPEELARMEHQLSEVVYASAMAKTILHELMKAFSEGYIVFDELCKQTLYVLKAEHITGHQRLSLLGHVVETALAINPPKRGRKSSRSKIPWIEQTCYDLVIQVNEIEHLPINRYSKTGPTAFQRVADEMALRRFPGVTESSVERAYFKILKALRSKSDNADF